MAIRSSTEWKDRYIMYSSAMYLRHALVPRSQRKIVERCVSKLEPFAKSFDAIVFTGLSGSLIAPIVAYELGMPTIYVRKPEVPCHSSHTLEGYASKGAECLFLDDMVESGATLTRVCRELEIHDLRCTGVLSYLNLEYGIESPDGLLRFLRTTPAWGCDGDA